MKIKVESQRTRNGITQCHKCQEFGHNQAKCRQIPRCVKCGQNHSTETRKKPRNTEDTCANYGGPHYKNT